MPLYSAVPLEYQTVNFMTRYPTQSHYPDSDLAQACQTEGPMRAICVATCVLQFWLLNDQISLLFAGCKCVYKGLYTRRMLDMSDLTSSCPILVMLSTSLGNDNNVTECEIGPRCWWPGLPLGKKLWNCPILLILSTKLWREHYQ